MKRVVVNKSNPIFDIKCFKSLCTNMEVIIPHGVVKEVPKYSFKKGIECVKGRTIKLSRKSMINANIAYLNCLISDIIL